MLLCLPILTVALVGAHIYALVVASDAESRGGIAATARDAALGAALLFASDDY